MTTLLQITDQLAIFVLAALAIGVIKPLPNRIWHRDFFRGRFGDTTNRQWIEQALAFVLFFYVSWRLE